MTFFRSILLLGGIGCSIAFVVLVGHAISTLEGRPVLIGAGLLALGVGLLAFYARTGGTPVPGGQ